VGILRRGALSQADSEVAGCPRSGCLPASRAGGR
jgi:hypothetical protein